MNMIEKVAEAIYESRRIRENRGSVTFAEAVKNRRSAAFTYMVVEDCRHTARAAIEAMREPTPEMLDAVTAADQAEPFSNSTVSSMFGEMIDAALEET